MTARALEVSRVGAYRRIVEGHTEAFALKIDGTVHAWGKSDFGQPGVGSLINESAPVPVGDLNE
jgi:alpha-tubulin suppressor-like RCC1 family protein